MLLMLLTNLSFILYLHYLYQYAPPNNSSPPTFIIYAFLFNLKLTDIMNSISGV